MWGGASVVDGGRRDCQYLGYEFRSIVQGLAIVRASEDEAKIYQNDGSDLDEKDGYHKRVFGLSPLAEEVSVEAISFAN